MTNSRWRQRFENFQKALARLDEACALESYSNLELAGLVQTFQFTFELCWKTLTDLLTAEGYEVNSPRETMRKAFEMSLIDDTERWFNALESRNLLSHIYNESTATQAEILIKNEFAPMIRKCCSVITLRFIPAFINHNNKSRNGAERNDGITNEKQ